MLSKKKVIGVKLETAYGVDAGPVGSDAILTSGLSRSVYEGSRVSRDVDRPELGNSEEINTGAYSTVTFDVELASSGTPGVAPAWGKLLRACAFSEVVDAADVSYQPVSDAFESCSIYYLLDGEVQMMTGCRGTVSFKLERGQLPKMSFTFTGLYKRPEAGTFTPDWSAFQAPLPVNEQNTKTYDVHGYSAVASSFEFDIANEIQYSNMIGAEQVLMVDRKPTGKVMLNAPSVGDKDFFEVVESHNGISTGPVEIEHGTQPGHIINISAPKTQLSTIADSDADGAAAYDMSAIYLPVSGDDEVKITAK